MKLANLLFILIIIPSINFGQDNGKEFILECALAPSKTSMYNELDIIDLRMEKTKLGIVQLGLLNRKAALVAKIPLSTQIQQSFKAILPLNALQAKLVLVLRQYSFAEVTGAVNEKGYVYLRASLYAENQNMYYHVNSIDTVYLVRNFDVTNALISEGSFHLVSFLWRNLNENPSNTNPFTINNLQLIDSVEKSKMPLYTVSILKDGAYSSYESFKNQTPDYKVDIVYNSLGEIKGVNYINEKGKKEKLNKNDIYALVDKGNITIVTKYGHYPMVKKEMDFYFIGRDKTNAKTGEVIVASVFFGVLGGLAASESYGDFEMKLDHINGGFIPIREILK